MVSDRDTLPALRAGRPKAPEEGRLHLVLTMLRRTGRATFLATLTLAASTLLSHNQRSLAGG